MSMFYDNNAFEGADFFMTTPEFSTNQVFESREQMMEWVQNIGLDVGVGVVTKRSNKDRSGNMFKVALKCDRGGKYKVKDSSKTSGTKKSNCPFELEAKYLNEYDSWTLRVICDEHNHQPIQYMEGHPYTKRLSDDEYSLVVELTKMNMLPRDILSIIKERNVNNVSTIRTIYNARNKFRMLEQVGKSPMQVLLSLLHSNGYAYEFSTTASNELENLFFVHPTSFDIWRAFPHVLIIDATYKTNKYNMPFVEIVGVTSTKKTFCIAFIFMQNEREVNYTWALNCLKLTLDKCMYPRVIATDRELALMNACKKVFPNDAQLLCRWHISQNLFRNCRHTIKPSKDWDFFLSLWELLENSATLLSYTINYMQLQSFLIKYPCVLKYVDDIWLKKYKEMFVFVWIDQHLNFGEHTTNRVESQHAKLKKYLESTSSSLDKFVGCIDRIVNSQVTTIKERFEKSRIFRIHQHNLHCFRLLHGNVSNEALEIMFGEYKRLNEFQLDSSNCGCRLRNSCGLPCACELLIYISSGQYIPLDSIDIFWRKLDISPSTSEQNDGISCDSVMEHCKQEFDKQSDVGKKSLLRKLKDIIGIGTTGLREPLVQKNTRGRPKLKKTQQKRHVDPTRQDSRRYSCSNTSNFVGSYSFREPARHSSYEMDVNQEPMIDLNKEPMIDLNEVPDEFESFNFSYQPSYSHNYIMADISDIFHPYITNIHNVDGDGNCGFRALTVGLGRVETDYEDIQSQLKEELESKFHIYMEMFVIDINTLYESCFKGSPAPRRYWMSMPEVGVLAANKFGVIVHCLDNRGSTTIFPFWKGPEEFQHHQAITIAIVSDHSHYVMVQLQGEYPMPFITTYWNYHRNSFVARWETIYRSRIELFNQCIHRERTFMDLGD